MEVEYPLQNDDHQSVGKFSSYLPEQMSEVIYSWKNDEANEFGSKVNEIGSAKMVSNSV